MKIQQLVNHHDPNPIKLNKEGETTSTKVWLILFKMQKFQCNEHCAFFATFEIDKDEIACE